MDDTEEPNELDQKTVSSSCGSQMDIPRYQHPGQSPISQPAASHSPEVCDVYQKLQSEPRYLDSSPQAYGVPAAKSNVFPPGWMITRNQIKSETVTVTGDVNIDDKERTNMQDQLLELLKKFCSHFVETSGYMEAKRSLDVFGHVTLIGEAGSGKTTIGYRLLKLYKDSKTFTPLIVDDVAELKRLRDPKEPTLIFINDVFGRSVYSKEKLQMWLPVFEQLRKTLNPNKFRIIFTSRNYIFLEAYPDIVLYKDSLFSENTVVDLSGDAALLQPEKQKLLESFAKRAAISLENEDLKAILEMKTPYGFPHACSLFSELTHWHTRPQEFFAKPVAVFIESVQHMARYDKNKFAILLLVLLGGGKLNLAKLRKTDDVLKIVEDYTTFQRIPELVARRHELSSPLIGSYLTSIGDTLFFRHPTVEDTVAYVIGTIDPLFLIEHCSMRVLYERLRIHSSKGKKSTKSTHPDMQWFHVVLSDDYREDLITKFVSEIKQRNFPLVCLHQACTEKRFVDGLFASLKTNGLLDKMHERDLEHKQNMLYWSVMNRSQVFFNKILKEVSYKPYELHNTLIACCITGNAVALRAILSSMTEGGILRLMNMQVVRTDLAIKNAQELIEIKKHDIYDDRLINMASRHGHIDVLKALVEAAFSIEGGKHVTSPLLSCCEVGHVNVIDYLLDQGANLEAKTHDGKTALHLCCTNGHILAVRKCMEMGSDVEASDIYGMTSLFSACKMGHELIAKQILKHGANKEGKDNMERELIYFACQGGCEDFIEENLMDQMQNVASIRSAKEETLLHAVATMTEPGREHKKCSIAQQLINFGANVNAVDRHGMTPLLIAAGNGYLEIAQLLIESGASTNVSSNFNQTFLSMAACGELLDERNLLLSVKADSKTVGSVVLEALHNVNVTDSWFQTLLHDAAKSGSTSSVRVLIGKKADVNCADERKLTPLHVAALAGRAEIVEELLQNEADVNATTDKGQTPLHLAAGGGNVETMKYLLEHDADVNATDKTKQTALHWASNVWWGGSDSVQVLLEYEADIDAVDGDKQTPLHLAVGNWGRVDTVQTLLDHGADANAANDSQQTPVHLAAQKEFIDIIELLVDNGATVNAGDNVKRTPLHLVAEEGGIETIQILLACKADTDAVDINHLTPLHLAARAGRNDNVSMLLKDADISAKDETGQTPLHLAAENGKEDTVQLLLERNAYIGSIDMKGRTPLHTSCENGRYEAASVLIENKADLSARDESLKAPLHFAAACERNHTEDIVEMLLGRKAEVNGIDCNKQTPLHMAAVHGLSESVQVLINNKAAINIFDAQMLTPLHLAARDGRSDICHVLLHNKAQINIRGENKVTSLCLAAKNGHTDTVKVLLRHKADVNVANSKEETPLHFAAANGHKEAVEVLLVKRAIVNARNDRMQTPLHLAAENDNADIVKVLLNYKADLNAVDDNHMTALDMARKQDRKETIQVLTV